MTPAQPPLPTDWSLLFQSDPGSHTSILILESLEGVKVAVTRQNAGRWAKREPEIPGPPSALSGTGGVKAPAATSAADVILVLGKERWARLSQEAAVAGGLPNATVAAKTKKNARRMERYAAALANMANSSWKFIPTAMGDLTLFMTTCHLEGAALH